MKFLNIIICLIIAAMAISCENKKTREEIEADFKNIDRTEETEEEILTYEQQEASLRENDAAFKTKMPTDEEIRKREAELKERKEKENRKEENTESAEESVNTTPESATEPLTDSHSAPVEQPVTQPVQNTGGEVVDGMAQ